MKYLVLMTFIMVTAFVGVGFAADPAPATTGGGEASLTGGETNPVVRAECIKGGGSNAEKADQQVIVDTTRVQKDEVDAIPSATTTSTPPPAN